MITHGLQFDTLKRPLADVIQATAARYQERTDRQATHAEAHPDTLAKWPDVAVEGIAIGPSTRVKIPVGHVLVGVE
jgi:hypothetical protein